MRFVFPGTRSQIRHGPIHIVVATSGGNVTSSTMGAVIGLV